MVEEDHGDIPVPLRNYFLNFCSSSFGTFNTAPPWRIVEK